MILHADMDAFYASVEQRDRPELRGLPVVVGGPSDRGVVAAASYEARRFGIHSAMPTAEARRLCPEAVFLRGDMKRYATESRKIFAIFRDSAPRVEGLSLDEAFLDLSGTLRALGPPREVGERLRSRVRKELGLVVSVGIAPVKMVAKIASAMAKPDGLLEVAAKDVKDFLSPLPVRRLWGVGAVSEGRLRRSGFETVGDLAKADRERLAALLGDWGVALARLARGEDVREVEPYRDAVSYSEENTFATDITDRRVLEATLLTHAEAVARRLRRDGVQARTVVLKIRLARVRSESSGRYRMITRRVTLKEPTDDGDRIASEGRRLLARLFSGEPIRLLGVGTLNLVDGGERQPDLFAPPGIDPRRGELNRALDQIRDRFGPDAVQRGNRGEAERAGLSLQIKRGEAEEDDGGGETQS
ncbi:MAG: DNA polymerase IV [Myxococcota bacterium]|nr:DNA polymerase IV [Myxococcota bacterium]